MPETRLPLSEYRAMWLFAMFDLPVKTKPSRREYAKFRNALRREGFCMLQYSVYARYCPSDEATETHRAHIRAVLPPKGQVRLLFITDRQFAKMEVYCGTKRAPTEPPPAQLMLF